MFYNLKMEFFQRSVSSFFLISLLCFIQFSSISCEKKVSLTLYYESLCPGCSNFIVNYLPKIFKNGMIDIVDLKLVPWGNTKIQSNNTFKCQHGPAECFLDMVEACALDVWPHLNEHFPFIYCVESLVYHKNYTQWETCFEKLNLKKRLITDCVHGERGKELELRHAAETPPHKFVPWAVVDGQPLYTVLQKLCTFGGSDTCATNIFEALTFLKLLNNISQRSTISPQNYFPSLPLQDYREFISYICKAYKGTAPIPGCSSSDSISFTSNLSTRSSAITSFVEQRVKLAASA